MLQNKYESTYMKSAFKTYMALVLQSRDECNSKESSFKCLPKSLVCCSSVMGAKLYTSGRPEAV